MKIGYCTTFQLEDKVKPITNDEYCPIITISAIQITKSQQGIREYYQVSLFSNGEFKEQWVECNQIVKV